MAKNFTYKRYPNPFKVVLQLWKLVLFNRTIFLYNKRDNFVKKKFFCAGKITLIDVQKELTCHENFFPLVDFPGAGTHGSLEEEVGRRLPSPKLRLVRAFVSFNFSFK